MERDRPVVQGIDELAHERVLRGVYFLDRPVRGDFARGDEIHVVGDLERLDDVVADDDRSHAERVIEGADQVRDLVQRDRV
ncbi:hypothetical protein D3C83_58860 [compost metagenome]